jgi:formylglycine-generating enzyme required for sulfatase activity
MIQVEGGVFAMGNATGASSEQPVHEVSMKPFLLAETEVTQALYMEVMGKNPSNFLNCDQCPVEQVSWENVQDFLARLNQMVAKKGPNPPVYRLPTEAEWEFAARGGVPPSQDRGIASRGLEDEHGRDMVEPILLWAGTTNPDSVSLYAWTAGNCVRTRPVKLLKPNALGLYDMSGNVWEWCQDWHADDYYAKSPAENPTGPAKGQGRALRGGAWPVTPEQMPITRRNYLVPEASNSRVGFRICYSVQ